MLLTATESAAGGHEEVPGAAIWVTACDCPMRCGRAKSRRSGRVGDRRWLIAGSSRRNVMGASRGRESRPRSSWPALPARRNPARRQIRRRSRTLALLRQKGCCPGSDPSIGPHRPRPRPGRVNPAGRVVRGRHCPSSQDVLFPGAGGRLRRGVLKRGLRYLGNLCWSKRARPALGRRGNSAEPPGKIADLGAAAGDDRRQPVLDCLHLVIT